MLKSYRVTPATRKMGCDWLVIENHWGIGTDETNETVKVSRHKTREEAVAEAARLEVTKPLYSTE